MKMLLLILCTPFALAAGAQEFEPDLQKQIKGFVEKEKEKQRFKTGGDTSIVIPFRDPDVLSGKQPGVYTLPQDGMPCIVPDTKDIVAIPNAFPKKVAPELGQIPNATPQSGEELRRNQRRFFAPPVR